MLLTMRRQIYFGAAQTILGAFIIKITLPEFNLPFICEDDITARE